MWATLIAFATLAGGMVTPPERPLAVARAGEADAFAVAGDAVLHARARGRVLEVRDGERVLHRFEAPPGSFPTARLAASAELVALIVATEDEGGDPVAVQSFAGPPAGPLEPLDDLRRPARDQYAPGLLQVLDGTLFTTEFRGDYGDVRFTVREPGAEPRRVDLPANAIAGGGPVFAGDLVAYADPGSGQEFDAPRRLTIRDWRTGEQVRSLRVPGGVEAHDLSADGRVVINEDGGGLIELRDGRLRRVTRAGLLPRYVGERIVFTRQGTREGDQRLMVVEPGGRVRRFGVPTAQVDGFATGDDRVVWAANGCLLTAAVTAAAAPEPGPGPCPRSEMFLDDEFEPLLRANRRVPLILRCIAAAPPGCRGTVRLLADEGGGRSASLRFRIPAGQRRRLAPRLTRRAYRATLREGRGGLGGACFEVRATAVDPAGRSSTLSDGYCARVPRR